MIRSLVDARAALVLVDPAAGLVFLDRFLEPGEPPGTVGDHHLCGPAALRAFVRDVWTPEVAPAIRRARRTKTLTCASATDCRIGGQGEYDTVWHFRFGRDPAGRLVLRAVIADDEVLVDPAEVAREHADQDRAIAQLAVACP